VLHVYHALQLVQAAVQARRFSGVVEAGALAALRVRAVPIPDVDHVLQLVGAAEDP
jgi:hypothetical protein